MVLAQNRQSFLKYSNEIMISILHTYNFRPGDFVKSEFNIPAQSYVADLNMDLLDVISLIWKLPYCVCKFCILFGVRCLWPRNPLYLLHWRQKLPLTLLYTVAATLNSRQLNGLMAYRKPSGQQIREYCAANNIKHEQVAVTLPAEGLPTPYLHFVTPRDASSSGPTVFYAHGGGYQYSMRARGCMPLAIHIARSCNAARIVFLEYSLTPATQYPGQLMQAVEGLRYLISQGTPASDLVLGGDSAGGHLIAGLLLHIKKPAPTLPPLRLQDKIRAVFLLSPWLTMKENSDSAIANEAYDFLQIDSIDKFAKLFNPNLEHIWANPIDTPNAKSVWKDVLGLNHPTQSIVGKLLVTAGDREVLYDSCSRFKEDLIQAKTILMDSKDKGITDAIQQASVVFAVGLGEVHVQPGLDASQRYYRGGTMTALTIFLQAI